MGWSVVLLAILPSLGWGAEIEGKVVNRSTRAPIAGATIRIYRGNELAATGKSDAEGSFRIEGLVDGTYRPLFLHDDYQRPPYHHPAMRLFTVAGNESRTRLAVDMLPHAKLAGRVLSPSGEPVAGVPVAMRRPWDQQWTQTTHTTETGTFRFPSLQSGAWILAAVPSFKITTPTSSKLEPIAPPDAGEEGQRQGWTTTFFPNVDNLASAGRIVLQPGMTQEGYDLRLRTVVLRRVAGIAVDEAGKPVPRVSVMMQDVATQGSNSRSATADADGRFEFATIHDGDWRLTARSKQEGVEYRGSATVFVSRRDVTNAAVPLHAPFAVSGRVERKTPGPDKVTAVYLIPEDRLAVDTRETFHQPGGDFQVKNVYPGRYRVLPAGYVPGYYVASIWYGDQDVTTQAIDLQQPPLPLRVVYSDGAARVTGKVEKGPGMTVLLVPQDEALRDSDQFIREAVCDGDGQFTIESLRPGTYYAFAFDRVEKQQLEDAEFVRRLVPSAVRVELKHGSTANIELRVQLWPEY